MPSNVGRAFAADRRHKIPVVVVLDPRALTYVRQFPGHGAGKRPHPAGKMAAAMTGTVGGRGR
jgi:hypothetical protein